MKRRLSIFLYLVLFLAIQMAAEDGSRLWLRQETGVNAQVTVSLELGRDTRHLFPQIRGLHPCQCLYRRK